jgi:hypothetical protein
VQREDIERFAGTASAVRAVKSEIEGASTLGCAAVISDGLPSRDKTLAISVNVAVTVGPAGANALWLVEQCRKPMPDQ